MLEVVQMPLARRIWRISKFFQIPINDERLQNLDVFDLEFYELSMIADDPKKLEKLQNSYYDPEYEEWIEEFELEQEQDESSQDEKSEHSTQLDMPDEETIEWVNKNHSDSELNNEYDEYDVSLPTDEISDWEEVK